NGRHACPVEADAPWRARPQTRLASSLPRPQLSTRPGRSLPAGEVFLDPVAAIVLPARRSNVSRFLRIGTDPPLVGNTPVGDPLRHQVIGRLSLLHPLDKRRQTVPGVRTGPPAAMIHPWNHKKPD